jgi:hypothetical protein
MIRQIRPEMIKFLDDRLAHNGLAQDAMEMGDARLLFSLAIEACVGIKERGGNNKGPMVELIQDTVGRAEGEAWCMSFMQTGIAYVEQKLKIASRFPVTEHCMTAWNQAGDDLRVKIAPRRGAIAIWQKAKTAAGHTGIYLEMKDHETFYGIEGNTEAGLSSSGQVVRDGGGIYRTKRSIRGTGTMKLKGFLKPF